MSIIKSHTAVRDPHDKVVVPVRNRLALCLAVGVVAFGVRLLFILHGGGLSSYGSYDDGVYYAAAAALVHGRLPYRDFLFIQPPGVALVGAPFAVLGAMAGDATGLAVARVVFLAVGGLNAALVAANLRRFGPPAACIGGLFYAVFFPAVYSERSILLEPVGTLGLLAALLLVQYPQRWAAGAAGAAAGAAMGMKIWYVVAAGVIAVFAWRRAHLVVAGAAAAVLVIYGPFLLTGKSAMVREVVVDQLGRARSPGTLVDRLETVLGAAPTFGVPVGAMILILAALVLTALGVTLVTKPARVYGVLLITNAAVLAASPSWFEHYASLTAWTIALCAGVAGGRLAGLPRAAWARAGIVALVVVSAVAGSEHLDRRPVGTRIDLAGLQRVVGASPGCVTADDPTLLALSNALTRDLRQPECVVWPDVTGWTYDADSVRVGGVPVPRTANAKWQADVTRFLGAGSVVILGRRTTGLSRASKAALEKRGVRYRSGPLVVIG
jgi:alpha-1,2-mannosyltransferase